MKRALFFLLASGALVTSAAAQTSSWDTGSAWDAPKKVAPKKAVKSSQADGQKTLQKGGAAAPAPEMPTAAEPAAAAAPASDKGFGGGGGGSNVSSGQSISIAPGTPVMLQSGRNVMAEDAAAARERRANRKVRRPKPWPPRPVVAVEAAPAAAPAALPAPVAPETNAAGSGTTAAGGAEGTATAAKTKAPGKTAAPKPVKKAPAAPAGW